MGSSSYVIMAVYHGDRLSFLRESMRSLLQAEKAGRILIGVDGPVGTDLSNYLGDLSRIPSVELHWYKENRGLAVVLNQLVDTALQDMDCQVVFRMDADDVCTRERFVVQEAFLKAHPDVGVLGSSAWVIDEQGKLRGHILKPVGHRSLVRRLSFDSPFVHPAVAIRSSVLRSGGFRYPVSTVRFEDVALWAKMALAGVKFANVGEKLLYYRQTAATIQRRRGLAKVISETSVRLEFVWKFAPYRLDQMILVCGMAMAKVLLPERLQRSLYQLRGSVLGSE